MLDIGWSEMLMIAVVAIVVIGPKDLPRALRTIGQWVGKARAMTRELQNSVNEMIADSELDELRKASNSIGDFSPESYLNQPIETTPPPPTPLKWPPDDEIDASDQELAEMMPDVTPDEDVAAATDGAEVKTPAKATDA